MAQAYRLQFKVQVPPIATHPKDNKKIRLVEDGEYVIPVRRCSEGMIVSLERDNYIAIVCENEIIKANIPLDE